MNKYCVIIYGSILMLFSPFFFKNDCHFRRTMECPFRLPGGATMFAKLRSRIAKSPKIDGKDS